MPDNVAGMAFRKSDGHRFEGSTIGEMGLNPIQRNAEIGKLELRTPADIAETLIHEFVHTYSGPDKFQAVRLGDRFMSVRQKGVYNEARAKAKVWTWYANPSSKKANRRHEEYLGVGAGDFAVVPPGGRVPGNGRRLNRPFGTGCM